MITGSFFDLQHINPWDGAYWTGRCRYWKAEQWAALMEDMSEIGIDTVICTTTAIWGRPLFPGYEKTVGMPLEMGCENPLRTCVETAGRLGMKVFLGVGCRGRVMQVRDYAAMEPPWPEIWFEWNTRLAEALLDQYAASRGFAGLYIPYEIDFLPHQVQLYEKWIGEYLRPVIGAVPVLASPGSLADHPDLDSLPAQLQRMRIDIVAPQDYGGRSNDVEQALGLVKRSAEALVKVSGPLRAAGVRLWANCETFSFESSPDGRAYCVPGPVDRIFRQIEMQQPHVEKIICYQYQGIMNRRTSLVDIGHPQTTTLYQQYRRDMGI